MLIFFADGRFGNQIFQYVFLRTIQKDDEKIFVFGFDQLMEVFEINNTIMSNITLKSKITRHIVRSLIKPFVQSLSRLGLFNNIHIINLRLLYMVGGPML